MAAELILAIVVGVIAIVEGIFLIRLYDMFKEEKLRTAKRLETIDIDAKLNSSFADSSSRGLENLTHLIAVRVKEHYGIKARSHVDLIEGVKASTRMKDDIKSLLVDFFTEMAHASYKNDTLTDSARDGLQHKARAILHQIR